SFASLCHDIDAEVGRGLRNSTWSATTSVEDRFSISPVPALVRLYEPVLSRPATEALRPLPQYIPASPCCRPTTPTRVQPVPPFLSPIRSTAMVNLPITRSPASRRVSTSLARFPVSCT